MTTLALIALAAAPVAGQSPDDRYGIVIGPAPAPVAAATAPEVAVPAAAPATTTSSDSQVLLSYDRDNPPTTSEGNPLRPAAVPPPIMQEPAPPSAASSLSAAAPFDLAEMPLATAPPAVEPQPAPTFSPGVVEPAAHEVELPAEPAEPPVAEATDKEVVVSVASDPLPGLGDDESQSRRLSPPSPGAALRESPGAGSRAASMLPAALGNLESLSTAGIALAAVVGLLVVCTWGLRRGGPKRGGMLPDEAFAVLGRAPLAAQSFAQLLRVGNKLVLVAITPQGAQALAEVTDPMEVGRLIGLCAGGTGHGPSAEFQQVLAQLAREPARGFLEKETHAGRR